MSGEAIEARAIYGKPFTMRNTCKLWFLSNHLPRFRHGTEAELRRVRFIRFNNIPEKKDVTLNDRIKAERNGTLGVMVIYLQRLLRLSEIPLGSAKSQEAHERFAITNDRVSAFVKAQYVLDRQPQRQSKRFWTPTLITSPDGLASHFFKNLYDRHPQLKEMRRRIPGGRQQVVTGIKITNGAQCSQDGQTGQGSSLC